MPERTPTGKAWHAAGYLQTFYCAEHSKEKAKALVYDYFSQNEENSASCQFRFDHVARMPGLKNRAQLMHGIDSELTEEMFGKRNEKGIWFCDEKQYHVSEEDYAASILGEDYAELDDDADWAGYEGKCQACDDFNVY
jgi:hypothetical protein